MAGSFVDRGHPTTVWNRTPGKAGAVVERGAGLAGSVHDAVTTSPLIVVCVLDDVVVDAIVTPVSSALRGRALVNLTADTPQRARDMAAWAAGHGIDYLDGAIMTPTDTIASEGAFVLYSGPEALFDTHRGLLDTIGTSVFLGTDVGRAAAHDVALIDMFWHTMTGIVHGFALAAAEGIRPSELAPFASGLGNLLAPIVQEIAGRIEDGRFDEPASSLRSNLASMDHIVHAAEDHGLDASVVAAAAVIARRAVDAGHGDDSYARLVDHLQPTTHDAAQPN